MSGTYCGVNTLGFEGYCGRNSGRITYANHKKNKMRNPTMNKKPLTLLIAGLLGSTSAWAQHELTLVQIGEKPLSG